MAGSIFDGMNLGDNLNVFKKQTNSQMGTVREGVLTPMDVTGDKMKEGVALVKPQDTSLKGTISGYKSSAVSELDGIIGMLSGGLLNTKDITKAIKVGPDGVSLSDDNILSSAAGEMGVSISGKTSAMRKLASMVTDEFRSITGVNMNGVITTDGKGYRINGNWRNSVGRETMAMIQKFTGIDEFVDTSVTNAMYNSVMKMAAGLGMSDSYKSIYDLYRDRRSAQQIMIDAVRTMISRGDIVSIDAVLALLDQQGINAINAGYPEFIKTLFRSFRFDEDVFPEDYPVLQAKLLSVLTRVCGPEWWMTYTQFGYAYDLTLINSASKDMIVLLGTVDYLQPMIAAAGMFQEQSAVTELKLAFKDAPVFDL